MAKFISLKTDHIIERKTTLRNCQNIAYRDKGNIEKVVSVEKYMSEITQDTEVFLKMK